MKFMLQHRLATPVIQPRMHFFDKDGKPLIGGKVYSFKVGEDIFKPTYRNSEFTAANQNPILLDQAGSALIYVRGSVQLKIYDKSGVFIEEKIVYQQQMRTQFFDKYGKALGGGKVWTYDYQSTIKKPSYENADDALLNPNPVILDENGWGSVSIVGAYRLRQYDKKGVFVGDQDFKRPPARVLTSVVYPLYFEENIVSASSVKLSLRFSAPKLLEGVKTSLSIQSAARRDVMNSYSNLESAQTLASLVSMQIIETKSIYKSYDLGSEMMQSAAALITAKYVKQVAYLKNEMRPENIRSTTSLTGAQYTN